MKLLCYISTLLLFIYTTFNVITLTLALEFGSALLINAIFSFSAGLVVMFNDWEEYWKPVIRLLVSTVKKYI